MGVEYIFDVQLNNVIVIDDEADITYILQQFLTKSGYNVAAFTDPLLSLDFFKINPSRYSLIITDLRMPGLSGIELANKIREINEQIMIILITAFEINDLSKNMQFINAKIDKVIQKPIKLLEIKKIVNDLLNIKHS